MAIEALPGAVRRKALASGAGAWLEGLPALVADLERDWSISVGPPYTGGTEVLAEHRDDS